MTLLQPARTVTWLWVTACCECKTSSTMDKMGKESWGWWAPGGGLGKQAPDLATLQVLHDKMNSINMKAELQFGHRLMISVCNCPGIVNRSPELQSLKSHPWSQYASWHLFLTGTPDVLGPGTSQCWKLSSLDVDLHPSLDVGQNRMWWCIICSFYFSFLLMLVCLMLICWK